MHTRMEAYESGSRTLLDPADLPLPGRLPGVDVPALGSEEDRGTEVVVELHLGRLEPVVEVLLVQDFPGCVDGPDDRFDESFDVVVCGGIVVFPPLEPEVVAAVE
jgi:hypothetical protein